MENQITIKNKKLLGGEVCLSGNASFQPVGESLKCRIKDCEKELTIYKKICTYHYNKKWVEHNYKNNSFELKSNKKQLSQMWKNMNQRCYYSKDKSYKYYGGRGIRVCKEWKTNKLSFYEWAMNNKYKRGLEIDRIDNDGGYYPENCRFVTHKVNNQNRRKRYIVLHCICNRVSIFNC